MSESCLFAKLGAYAPLSDADKEMLAVLELEERPYRKDQIVRRVGQPVEELYVVKTGWLCSFSILEDGRRQILRLFYPGDIVDLSEVAMARASHDVKCITAAVLCPFPKAGLEPVFATSPRLTALLYTMTVRETLALLNRIRAIGRLSAYERVCYLFLEIRDRLRMTTTDVDDGFHLPLTQSDLADLLGLTNVYVSKTISRIEGDGLIVRRGSRVILKNQRKMIEICEYQRPAGVDLSWFPQV